MEDRIKLGERGAKVGVFGNIILSTFKLIVGIVSNSTAVMADSMHSLSDVATSLMVWVGIRMSDKPPDEEHPYGHGDVEPIVGLLISIALVLVGFEFARHAINEIFTGVVAPTPLAAYATVFVIIYKEGMARYVLSVADKIKSPALKADAQHHRSDVYSSIAVLIGVSGSILFYPILDPLAGIVVSLIVIKMGFDVGRENIQQLMGTVPSPEVKERIERLALSVKGVKMAHNIRIHYFGAYATVDLHVCVDESLLLSEAHKIAHQVQRKIVEIPEISSALVHVEPFDVHHKEEHAEK